MKTIFETPELFVTCKDSLSGKSVIIEVIAVNPEDGKTYRRCAGWLSTTYTLHSFDSTRAYAFSKAIALLSQFKSEILEAMVAYAAELGSWASYDLQTRLDNAGRKETYINHHPVRKGHVMDHDFWIGKIRTAQL